MSEIESAYFDMLQNGCTPEQARCVLPNSLKTEIIMTANLREWRHFFKLRTSKSAHPQMREIAVPLLNELKSLIPVIFDDIGVKREDAADAVLDVIEVVRCQDCKHCDISLVLPSGRKMYTCMEGTHDHQMLLSPNDFCSRGERRKDERVYR